MCIPYFLESFYVVEKMTWIHKLFQSLQRDSGLLTLQIFFLQQVLSK